MLVAVFGRQLRTSFHQSVTLLYCIASPINLLALVADNVHERGKDNIVVLSTIQRLIFSGGKAA
jgi:hypothetical protein